ncbi:MAG: hypothetical protein IJS05_02205 [Paludibacteraceae bacterium]|nr:hypothetical protein [Paludibacteraceae bacterium]
MASASRQLLDELTMNVEELLKRYDAVNEQLDSLRYQNEQLRAEMVRTHAELSDIQRKFRNLQSAYTLSGNTEQREQAKRRLTHLIEYIDKALECVTIEE